MRASRAFTLVEVLTVIAIIGILVAVSTYAFQSSLIRSRDYQRLTDMQTLHNTLQQSYLDNRSYPPNHFTTFEGGSSYPWVAKYQLEKYIGQCANIDKSYLAPRYISTIPEDPSYKLRFTEQCGVNFYRPNLPAGYGQYLYIGLVANQGDPVRDYLLFARMERPNNVTNQKPDAAELIAKYPYSANIIDINNSSAGLPYYYCDQSEPDPVAESCSYNYYLRAGAIQPQ